MFLSPLPLSKFTYISTDVNYVPADNNELFSSLDNTKDDCVGYGTCSLHSLNSLIFQLNLLITFRCPVADRYPFREHFPFRKNPVHNMDTEIIATATPFESGKSAGDKPQLRCLVPECLQDSEFPSESALRFVHSLSTTDLTPTLTHLRKHEAKHSKPYICQVSNCRHTRFGNKGGLDRYSREVHGSQTYCCPVTSCKRHVRGFPRKFNLYEHQKRCHSSQSLNLLPPSILGQQVQTSGSMNERNLSYEGGFSPEMVVGDSERLREKLEKLHKKRMEIDVDIDAVKRSLDLLGEDSL